MRLLFTIFQLLIFTITFAQSSSECEPVNNKKAEKLVKGAIADIKTRNYLKANHALKDAIAMEPDYAEAYYLLGLINVKRIDYNVKAAEQYFLKAIEICPTVDVYAYYYLGDICFGAKKYEQAAKYFKEFLKDVDKIKSDKDYNDASEKYNRVSFFDKAHNKPVPFDPRPVRGISSPLDEYLAIISPDNEMALFTRRIEQKQKTVYTPADAKYIERFMFSKRQDDGEFDNGEFMPYPFNQQNNEGGATLTIDNRELFYTVCIVQNNYLNCDIYTSKFENGSWSDIKNLGPNVNMPDTWETQPTVSSDGKTLYYVSDRKGGLGGYDLYKTVRDEEGNWGKAVNLGSPINTPGNERSPFIHTDSQTLYYASGDRLTDTELYNGHLGFGGYDIFYTKMNDKGEWVRPKNIGYPINTEADEASFFVSTDGKTAYVASNKLKGGPGGWDLYCFELYPEARPEKVLFIKGEVSSDNLNMDTDKEPVTKVELKNAVTKKVTHIPVNKETGQYVAAIKFDSDYILTVKKENHAYESMYISEDDDTYEKPVAIDFEVKTIEKGKEYTLKDINFETDKYDLNERAKLIIEEFADFMKDHPKIEVEIQGHTDNIGNPDYNLFLSDDRARAVYDYLIKLGVDKKRIGFKGYGVTRPIESNATEAGRARNRRTVFFIVNQ